MIVRAVNIAGSSDSATTCCMGSGSDPCVEPRGTIAALRRTDSSHITPGESVCYRCAAVAPGIALRPRGGQFG